MRGTSRVQKNKLKLKWNQRRRRTERRRRKKNVELWSQNKYEINRIRNPSIQLRSAGRKTTTTKTPTHYNIFSTRLSRAEGKSALTSPRPRACLQALGPSRKQLTSRGQWNNEKAVLLVHEAFISFFFSRVTPSFPSLCPASVWFTLMWPNNKSKWVSTFIPKKCEKWEGEKSKTKARHAEEEESESRKKYLLEWLIKLDVR